MKITRPCAAALAASLLAGCASTPFTIAPLPPTKYQVLGKAEGKACGSLGFLATAYYVAPIGLNSRVERAYQEALASVPGATRLVNVSITEDWQWLLLVTMRCTTITGDAVKEVA
ncbi:MAG TPA: hypothetical protein VGD46_19835 [Rhizobacter sp.]